MFPSLRASHRQDVSRRPGILFRVPACACLPAGKAGTAGAKIQTLFLIVAVLSLGACVAVPQSQLGISYAPAPVTGVFPGLGAGRSEVQSAHFLVHAYGEQNAEAVSSAAEADYQSIMVDTNLMSFYQPSGLFQIYVYADSGEYFRKTRQPGWSGGLCAGNAVYVYQGSYLWPILAHELTHVVFYEYLARKAWEPSLRWINEGLATYEESKAAAGGSGFTDIFLSPRPQLLRTPIPMDKMLTMVPANEKAYKVSLWYAEAEGLVHFMISKGGPLGFYLLIKSIKGGEGWDVAMGTAFSAQGWSSLEELYQAWAAAGMPG